MKTPLLLTTLILIAFSSTAQFTPNDISKYTNRPSDVKAFDLDGDGDLDVLTASESDNKIAWYENLGGGVFGPQRIISTDADFAQSVYAVDIDGDGDLDVISASKHDNKIAWYENDGQGNFGSQQIISTEAYSAQSVYAADLDGDGDMDVLSASQSGNHIVWYENDGQGNFGPQQIISNDAAGGSSVYAADLDGDGLLDVISASAYDNKIAWYKNLGDGNFGSQQIVSTLATGASSVYAADMDGDGDLDILSACKGANRIAWYKNEGGGSFGAQTIISNTANMVKSVYAADLDGDGYIDVLAACGSSYSSGNKIIWHRNLGNGYFGSEQIISSDVNMGQSVYAGDLDDDSDMDVISASMTDHKIAWYENTGDGNFNSQQLISIEVNSARSVHAGDLNNDGNLDVITASFLDNKIAWYENLGDGTFGPQRVISTNANQAVCVYTADLDGDGDLDILSASQGDDKIAWYENDGEGNFGPEQILSSQAAHAQYVYAADMDGDGDLDVVFRKVEFMFGAVNLAWIENLGNGIFGEEHTITTDVVNAVFIADVNGDGNMDAITATTNDIGWYENLGDGTFGTKQIITVENNSKYLIYAEDLDGDGDIDVLAGSYPEGQLVWFENDGTGSFGDPQMIYLLNDELSSVYAADLNDDGNMDVIAAVQFVGNVAITWYENDGNGNFGPQQIVDASTRGGGSIYVCDLDGDGDLDVLSARQYNLIGGIAWHKNNLYHHTQITGRLFLDINQNGVEDSLDIGFNQLGVFSIPQSEFTYTYPNGNYFMNFSNESGIYQIFPELYPGWIITTDSLSYTISIDSSSTFLDSLNFGFSHDSIFTVIQTDLTGGIPRCNETINYWIDLHNYGTTQPSGIIHLQLPEDVTFISAEAEPDSVSEQNVYWRYDSLFYFSATNINLKVEMPPFTSMADTLISILVVHELDEENNIIYSNTDTLQQIVVCAYDPNDKSVNPVGVGSAGYIHQNQELAYLVRFQNTGNDTAITVIVRDQLDENLDWSSFHPIASSHPMHVHIEHGGEAVFTFDNILLPDSNVDFLGSQGFVKFRIMPKDGLLPNTAIHNTANIYFDLNPAVITNTILNTIACYATPQPEIEYVDNYLFAGVTGDLEYQWFFNGLEISEANSDTLTPVENGIYSVSITDSYDCSKISEEYLFTSVGTLDVEQIKAVLYPNPFTESSTVVFAQNLNADYDIIFTNIDGRVVQRINKFNGNKLTLHKSEIGSGVFFCYLLDIRTGRTVSIEKFIIL